MNVVFNDAHRDRNGQKKYGDRRENELWDNNYAIINEKH